MDLKKKIKYSMNPRSALILKKAILSLFLLLGGERMGWRAWRDQGLVLSFHGVVPDDSVFHAYPYHNFIPVSVFKRQIDFLRGNCHMMSLREMAIRVKRNETLPRRSVAVTFDDGYRNNLYLAAPILEKNSIPATFFISTGFLGRENMLPAEELKLYLYYSADARVLFSKYTQKNPASFKANEPLSLWVRDAVHLFKTMEEKASQSLMTSIKTLAHMPAKNLLPFEFLGQTDVKKLSSISGFDIGGHTVNHCILSRVSKHRAAEEILKNKSDLEMLTGRRVDLFAYPNGCPGDFTSRDQELLKQAGFLFACTQSPGYLSPRSSFYALPRFDIGQGHSGVIFRAYVSGVIPQLRGMG